MRNLEKQCSLCNVIFYFTLNNFCEPPKYEHFLAKLFFLVPIIASFCKIWQKVFHAYQKLPERKIFFPPMQLGVMTTGNKYWRKGKKSQILLILPIPMKSPVSLISLLVIFFQQQISEKGKTTNCQRNPVLSPILERKTCRHMNLLG